MIIEYILCGLTAYLLGTIPWALILVKLFSKKDILSEGSGNVGAMNSYEITGKKWLGILVFFLDALKGIAAIIITRFIADYDFTATIVAITMVVLGHNFNVFLKFKGGRGLSTGFGAALMVNPLLVIVWGILWLLGYLIIKRNVHIANITAIILTPITFLLLPESIVDNFYLVPIVNTYELIAFISFPSLLFLIRHIKPLMDLMKKNSN